MQVHHRGFLGHLNRNFTGRLLIILTAAFFTGACSPQLVGNEYVEALLVADRGADPGVAPGIPPSAPTVLPAVEQYTSLSESPPITWIAPPSNENLTYEYSIGTSASDNSVREWTSVGSGNTISVSGLSLAEGTTYYLNIRAVSQTGTRSGVASTSWLAQRVAPVALAFSGTETLFTGYCAGPYVIESRNSNGLPWAVTHDTSITLSSASGRFFSDSACSNPISSITLPKNSSTINVHYRTNLAGTDAPLVSAESLLPSGLTIQTSSKQERMDLFAGVTSHLGYKDGSSSEARFHFPTPQNSPMQGVGSVVMLGGSFFVSDPANCVIRRIDRATGAVSTLAGQAGDCRSIDGTSATARFHNPSGIATDGSKLYVSDSGSHTLRSINVSDASITTIAGTAGAWGHVNDVGAAARFTYPAALVHIDGALYVTDTSNHAVRKVDLSTLSVTTLAGGNNGTDDGTGAAAQFGYPMGIATDGTDVYVADSQTNLIRRVTLAGVVTTIAGSGACGSDDGDGTLATFCQPAALTITGASLYIADTFNNKIRRMTLDTLTVTTFAGSGAAGNEDGTGLAATFNRPGGLASDETAIYVVDALNQGLRRIQLSDAAVARFAGTSPNTGMVNGAALSARFNSITGIVKVGTDLYITEGSNHVIRRVSLRDGQVSAFVGEAGIPGSADGIGAAAKFNNPMGLASDGTHLYVADYDNHTIRKITLATAEVKTIAGLALSSGTTNGTGSAARFAWPHSPTLVGTDLFVAAGTRIRRVNITSGAVDTPVTGLGTIGGMTNSGGYLYLTETFSRHMIRRIQIGSWAQTVLAGAAASGYTDATGPDARFNDLGEITTDGTNAYAIDKKNKTIRAVSLGTGAVSTYLASPPIQADIDGVLNQAHVEGPLSLLWTDSGLFVGNSSSLRWIH